MDKRFNINLSFTADTARAKKQMQELRNSLQSIMQAPINGMPDGLSDDLVQASRAAAELEVHLRNAVNTKTGTIDFSKFNQSLKESGTSLKQYGQNLISIGNNGQKAFLQLTSAIAQSETPLRRTNGLLTNFLVTLKNTAKWQISSSILHGLTGAVQSAFSYAEDLNESLNNIRIVTGYNTEQMAKFASQANKAAKALSTTTTAYTDPGPIYAVISSERFYTNRSVSFFDHVLDRCLVYVSCGIPGDAVACNCVC